MTISILADDYVPQVIQGIICIFIAGIVGITIVGGIAMWRTGSGAAKSFGLLFARAVPMTIVIFITLAVFVLCMGGKISGEAAIAALAGAAGGALSHSVGAIQMNAEIKEKPEKPGTDKSATVGASKDSAGGL